MYQQVDVADVHTAPAQQIGHALERSLFWIIRCGQEFVHLGAAVAVEQHQVGKRTADVQPDRIGTFRHCLSPL